MAQVDERDQRLAPRRRLAGRRWWSSGRDRRAAHPVALRTRSRFLLTAGDPGQTGPQSGLAATGQRRASGHPSRGRGAGSRRPPGSKVNGRVAAEVAQGPSESALLGHRRQDVLIGSPATSLPRNHLSPTSCRRRRERRARSAEGTPRGRRYAPRGVLHDPQPRGSPDPVLRLDCHELIELDPLAGLLPPNGEFNPVGALVRADLPRRHTLPPACRPHRLVGTCPHLAARRAVRAVCRPAGSRHTSARRPPVSRTVADRADSTAQPDCASTGLGRPE